MTEEPFNLQRFVSAQADTYAQALAELRRGCKRTHWMWFVFPQLRGLGRSEIAQFYAISNRHEAAAYLAHPLLGPRLLECCAALLALDDGLSASTIFGNPDDLKLRSSLTLFYVAAGDEAIFALLLDRYFDGQPDPRTLELLPI